MMTINSLIQFILLTALLLIAGCGGQFVKKSSGAPQKSVVWADDGSQVAIINIRLADLSSEQEQYQHQIAVQNVDGSGQRSITEWRDYQPGRLFYMKQAGYFVLESLLDNGARRFDKIALNGNEILIIETPDDKHQPCQNAQQQAQVNHSVIPSPDGLQLAHIYSPLCGKVTVEFLHANNLNLFDNQTLEIDGPKQASWHPEGYVILGTNNSGKGWKIVPFSIPQPIPSPFCLSPVTTSSEISLEGQQVYFENDKLVTKNVGRQKAFGCQ
jgi:hypothetical protein